MFYQYISTANIASKNASRWRCYDVETTETIHCEYHVVKCVYVFTKFPPKIPFTVKYGIHRQSPPRRIVMNSRMRR